MIAQKINICNTLFYMLGVFASIQLLSIAGITIFNILLLLTMVVSFLINSKKLKNDYFFTLSILATLCTFIFSLNNEFLTSEFKKNAIIGAIIYLIVLVVYLIMNTQHRYAEKLIKGFCLSCKLTLAWCVLQILLFYVFHADLNALFFGDILKITGARGDYYRGILIPSGFFYHRAILIPSLIFLFFFTTNLYLMSLIVVIGCLTRSTALIIGLVLACLFRIIYANIKNFRQKINRKQITLILSLLIITIIGMVVFNSKILEIVSYVITRLADVTTNKADNSSVVHFLYYKNLIPILQKIDLKNIIFGTGFGTSGQQYTWFNGQYANLTSWVVESDYINILLNQGISGLLLWGYILIKLIRLSKSYEFWENIAFVSIITFVGIMYNIQFTWFIVIEMGMLVLTKRKIRIFNM